MSHYQDSFKFNVKDIDLIEHALREQIHALSDQVPVNGETESARAQHCYQKIRELHQLLGKIHNQKIWYGEAHHTKDPISG